MSPFDVLLIAHLFGDFIFQTNWMAVNKANRTHSLLFHALTYTLTIYLFAVTFSVPLSVWAIALVFVSHCILDRRVFTKWWVKTVMKVDGREEEWLVIMVDQAFHIFVLAVTLYI